MQEEDAEQIDVPVPHVELAVPSGEYDTTSADVTAVVKPAGEASPPWFVMCNGLSESESELGESSDEESSDESRQHSRNSSSRKIC